MKRPFVTHWPLDITFFCDEDLGTRVFPDALRAEGVNVEILLDNFPSGTPDAEWIPEVARRNWVVLTHNLRIRYNRLERDTVMRSGSRMIAIRVGDARAEMAEIFLASRSRVLTFLEQNNSPFVARMYRNRIAIWLNHDNWNV